MEVDTRASFSIISESTYHKLWPAVQTPPLKETNIRLTTYTGEVVPLIGAIDVKISKKRT